MMGGRHRPCRFGEKGIGRPLGGKRRIVYREENACPRRKQQVGQTCWGKVRFVSNAASAEAPGRQNRGKIGRASRRLRLQGSKTPAARTSLHETSSEQPPNNIPEGKTSPAAKRGGKMRTFEGPRGRAVKTGKRSQTAVINEDAQPQGSKTQQSENYTKRHPCHIRAGMPDRTVRQEKTAKGNSLRSSRASGHRNGLPFVSPAGDKKVKIKARPHKDVFCQSYSENAFSVTKRSDIGALF